MINTYPRSLNEGNFVFGPRVKGLLEMPFNGNVLKKRVLQKSKSSPKGKAAYFIDIRDMVERLDAVVGWENWSNEIELIDAGDRIIAISKLRIGGVVRMAEMEAPKNYRKDVWEYNPETKRKEKTGKIEEKPNDMSAVQAGPSATKRAAASFGVGAYLYNFSNVNTWEEIDDYGNFKSPDVDISKLPNWAHPPGAKLVLLNELYVHFGHKPVSSMQDFDKEKLEECLKKFEDNYGITVDEIKQLGDKDLLILSGAIARATDSKLIMD